jgi:uncharacterized membrane protein YkvA (DUF1232 family)
VAHDVRRDNRFAGRAFRPDHRDAEPHRSKHGRVVAAVPDRHCPLSVRLVLAGLMAWILSPIDLIPEFVPVLGPLDDIVVAVVAMRYVRRRLGVDELRARWPGTSGGFGLLVRVIGS